MQVKLSGTDGSILSLWFDNAEGPVIVTISEFKDGQPGPQTKVCLDSTTALVAGETLIKMARQARTSKSV